MLRNLARDYFNRQLTLADYRARRKRILDEIDEEYNGVKAEPGEPGGDDESRFMGTIAFFNKDEQQAD